MEKFYTVDPAEFRSFENFPQYFAFAYLAPAHLL